MGIRAEALVGKGWREYRPTGGRLRYAMDREWIKIDGQWRKRARNRADLPPMTEEQYAEWKAERQAARAAARRATSRVGQVREVVVV